MITGPRYIGGLIATTAIGVIVVWIRMYVRTFISHSVGSDDWTMFAASVRHPSTFPLLCTAISMTKD